MMFFFKGRSVIVAPVAERAKPDGTVSYIPRNNRTGRRIDEAAGAIPSDRQTDEDKPLL